MIHDLATWQLVLFLGVLIGFAMDIHALSKRPDAPVWMIYLGPVIRNVALIGAIILALEMFSR